MPNIKIIIGYKLKRCVTILNLVELCKALKKCCLFVLNPLFVPFLSLLSTLLFGTQNVCFE